MPGHVREHVVVVVEDHPGYAVDVESSLKDAFDDLPEPARRHVVTIRIATEKNFREYLNGLTPERVPSIFLVDTMLRWTDPAPDLKPPPDDVRKGGYVQAGLRCIKLIGDHPLTSQLPIILNTILDKEDITTLLAEEGTPLDQLPNTVEWIHKGQNGRRLALVLRKLLTSH